MRRRPVRPEVPVVGLEVARRVLPRAVLHVLELARDLGPRRPGPLAVRVGILDGDEDGLRSTAPVPRWVGRPEPVPTNSIPLPGVAKSFSNPKASWSQSIAPCASR